MARGGTAFKPKSSWERIQFQVGIIHGQQDMLQLQIEHLWGPMDEACLGQLRSLASIKLITLGRALWGFGSREDLDRWLTANA